MYLFTKDDLEYFKRKFTDYATRAELFKDMADIPEIDLEDRSTHLEYKSALITLENIQEVCNKRIKGILAETNRELNKPLQGMKVK